MESKNSIINNTEEKLDCDGFLKDIDFWTSDFAEKLAKENKIAEYGLTEVHWEVINFIRDYYQTYGRGPEVVKVAKNSGLTMDNMCALFPCGLVKGAYKLAGLPRPPGCI